MFNAELKYPNLKKKQNQKINKKKKATTTTHEKPGVNKRKKEKLGCLEEDYFVTVNRSDVG